VDMGTGEIVNVQIKRAKVLAHFVNKPPCLIAIEACGGAHHWARELTALGHSVRLLHAKAVRPFVSGNKTDATDARAIWLAVQQPGVKFVGVKTAAQQATLTLHRQRELMMKMRTMQTSTNLAPPLPRGARPCSARSSRRLLTSAPSCPRWWLTACASKSHASRR